MTPKKEFQKLIIPDLKNIGPEHKLYFHFPFCARKCRFCVYFDKKNVGLFSKRKSDQFLEYFEKEIELYARYLKRNDFEYVHIGGGTPNLISPKSLFSRINRIVDFKKTKCLVLEVFPKVDLETYLEQLDFLPEKKISIGIQSLNEKVLRRENRFVSKKIMLDNLKMLSESGLTWAVDLIYGLESQHRYQVADYLKELEKILSYRPDSVSLYPLKRQTENVFYGLKNRPAKKKLLFRDNFDFSPMYSFLGSAGYQAIGHEWCRPGSEIKKYAQRELDWCQNPDVLALGPGVRSRTRSVYFYNKATLKDYIYSLNRGEFPIAKYLDFKNSLYLISTIAYSVYSYSTFDLKKLFSLPGLNSREKKEVLLLIDNLKKSGIDFLGNGTQLVIPKNQFTEGSELIEKYLTSRSAWKNY